MRQFRLRRRVCLVVWVTGFEPVASAFRGRPSTGLTLHPEIDGRGREDFMMGAIVSTARRFVNSLYA